MRRNLLSCLNIADVTNPNALWHATRDTQFAAADVQLFDENSYLWDPEREVFETQFPLFESRFAFDGSGNLVSAKPFHEEDTLIESHS